MPTGNWDIEWLNHNSQRHYPLADDAAGVDQSGSFKLPTDFIVGMVLPVHAGMDVDPGRFYIMNIGAYAGGYSVVVGYAPSDLSDPVIVATALIPTVGHTRNAEYALGGKAPFDDTMGTIVIGRLDNINQQPPGFWTFDFDNGRLDVNAAQPIIRGVSGIVVVNGTQRSKVMRGIIEIQAGSNTQLVPIIQSGQDPIIRVNFINGEGTIETCVCDGDVAQSTPVTNFNGQPATPAGDFWILGSECIEVQTIENGIKIVNTCAKPCCACPELEEITRTLERLQEEKTSVVNFTINTLGPAVNAMSLTVLGARLNDRGCVQCG